MAASGPSRRGHTLSFNPAGLPQCSESGNKRAIRIRDILQDSDQRLEGLQACWPTRLPFEPGGIKHRAQRA